MELKDKRALVTGGGQGIGRVIALALAEAGARVGLLARTRGPLEETAGQVRALGRDSWVGVADSAQPAQVQRAVGALLEQWGGIDILVNNAGIQGPIGLTHEVVVSEWIHAIQVNLVGCFLCTRLVLPGMMAQGGGKIVNLSGGGAVSPRPRYSAYSAAKAGVVRFTETLAAEVAPFGIDVNAVAPGPVNTRMLEETLAAGQAAGEAAQRAAQEQRESGGADPRRAAELVVFLASARSDGLTGKLLSAIWDRWQELDIEAVMRSELYNVRRLVPANRGD